MSTPTPGPFGSNACGCTVGKLGKYISIDYCSVHEAAADLLAALEGLLKWEVSVGADEVPEIRPHLKAARDAIAKARGGK